MIAIGYGALEGVEAYGLFRRRRWAEYLTVVATSLLFIPEIWELVKKPSLLKIGGIAVNAMIVAYLIYIGCAATKRGSSTNDDAGSCLDARWQPPRLPV